MDESFSYCSLPPVPPLFSQGSGETPVMLW